MKLLIASSLLLLFVATDAWARADRVDYPVAGALATDLAKEALHNLPFAFTGASHSLVERNIATGFNDRTTRSIFRSDEYACQVAFLSALKGLQERAVQMGADGVVNIRSTTRGETFRSRDRFQCVVGYLLANVSLTGDFVSFAR